MPTRVLIIDDEVRATDALVLELVLDGFLVDCERTGKDGVARASVTHPDVIVLDLRLPDVLGVTVLSELRRARIGAPVVVLTGAFLDDDHEVAARAVGAAVYLHKPILGDELTATLRSAIVAPPPEVAAPIAATEVPCARQRRHRSDPTSALHARNLAHDLAAVDELAAILVPTLKQRLRRQWMAIDDAALHDAAVDAVIHYLRHPSLFDDRRGVPLEAFLYGIAHRKLRDRFKADAARRQREHEWGRQTTVAPRDPEAQAVAADLRCRLETLADTPAEIRAVRRWVGGEPGGTTTAWSKRLKDRIRIRARRFLSVPDRKRRHDSQ